MEACFVKESWLGGFYELALEYEGPTKRLKKALKAIWSYPDVQGCYLLHDLDPSAQERVAPSLTTLESGRHLLGIAKLPDGKCVPCGTYLVREEKGSDWIGFYVPMGALAKVYDAGAYPFGQSASSREWREPLERWLAGIGQAVFVRAPFLLGIIGLEVSGETSARQMGVSGVPDQRTISYLVPAETRLTWYATNQWQQTPAVAS